MEGTTISLAIAIIGSVMTVINFVFARKDKSNKDIREEQKQFDKHSLIEYRLTSIEKQLEKILGKLDSYEREINDKVNEAIENHVKVYHKKGD